MKKRKNTLLFVLIIIFSACNNRKQSIEKLKFEKQELINYSNKTLIHVDLIKELEKFIGGNNQIEVKKENNITLLSLGENSIKLENDEIREIKTNKRTYLIDDYSNIELESIVNNKPTKGRVNEGVLDGILVTNIDSDILEIKFLNGDTVAVKKYDNSGAIKLISNYKNNQKHGLYTEFYFDKKKKLEVTYIDSKKEGNLHEWYKNGKLRSNLKYRGNKLHGEQTYFYETTSTMRKKLFFKNGKREGKQVAWYENAKTMYVVYFKNDQLDGEAVIYHKNIDLMKMKGIYQEGYRNGDFTIWDDKGQGVFVAEYDFSEIKKMVKGEKEEDPIIEIEDIFFD